MVSVSVHLALYLTIAAVHVRTQALGQCSAPWVPFQSSCYVFATGYPEDWTEAGAFCSRLGAKLAEIETVEENNFLRLHAFDMHAGRHFWVGGTDVLVDGQWIWISTQEKMQFTDWLPGEPNGGLREGCLMLVSGSNNYHWNDANCHSQQSFICEKEVEIGGDPSIIG